jgi:hypothetical protein
MTIKFGIGFASTLVIAILLAGFLYEFFDNNCYKHEYFWPLSLASILTGITVLYFIKNRAQINYSTSKEKWIGILLISILLGGFSFYSYSGFIKFANETGCNKKMSFLCNLNDRLVFSNGARFNRIGDKYFDLVDSSQRHHYVKVPDSIFVNFGISKVQIDCIKGNLTCFHSELIRYYSTQKVIKR